MYNVTTTMKSGGIETFYWEVSKELKNRSIEVDIVSATDNYIKYPDLEIHQFDYTSRNKILDFGNRFKKWGERISFFKNAYPYLKTQKYDYILLHKPMDFFVAYFMKRINPKIKTIFVSGGEDFYGFDKFFVKYVDFIFAVSQSNTQLIKKRYNKKVWILHNGVDINIFKKDINARNDLRKKYNLEDKKVLISVGRIVPLKGYQLVIKALRDLSDLHYILIGRGEYLEKLKKLAKEYKVESRVLFLGEINNNSLNKYLSMADLFVQPTIGNEAFGITIIEAMACELNVVASRNGGIVDIIKNDSNGYLFEINDVKQMKEKIKLALKSDINPRGYVMENFTWKRTVDRLLYKIKKDDK